ncbi:hypothetical protein [Nostoc sp.]
MTTGVVASIGKNGKFYLALFHHQSWRKQSLQGLRDFGFQVLAILFEFVLENKASNLDRVIVAA